MPEFIDLFNKQLKCHDVFVGKFDKEAVFTFLLGVRDKAKIYLPEASADDQGNASKVAGHFIDEKSKAIKYITPTSPIDHPKITDIGTALAYLFDMQIPGPKDIETGYRPILHVYGRLAKSCGSTMTVIVFDSATNRFHYGSTLAKGKGSSTIRDRALRERFAQLKAAMGEIGATLPTIPPIVARELSKQLARVRVPGLAGLREAPITEQILQLYDQWITQLVKSTSMSYPMELTFTADKEDLAKLAKLAKEIAAGEEDQYKPCVEAALEVNDTLKNELSKQVQKSVGQLYGHCAETFPFINLIKLEDKRTCQGLAMRPAMMKDLTENMFKEGTETYSTQEAFSDPCRNCASLVQLMRMDSVVYNSYMETKVKYFVSKGT